MPQKNAFTLIELLIVISVMMILVMIGIGGFHSFATKSGTDVSMRTVLGALEEARARALSAHGATAYGVHFATSSVTIFPGTTYDTTNTNNTTLSLRRAEIVSVSLTGGANDVVFSRLRGDASATGTVMVRQTSDTALSRTITIHATGLAESN